MKLTDTHTHLFVEKFKEDRDAVIQRAIDSGVKKMILPGINSSYIPLQLELADRYPNNCYPAVGLHPSDVKGNCGEELKTVEQNAKSGKFIAIGEIGIDLYWDKTFIKEQIIAFRQQIELAKKINLPIIIHVREAFKEVFEVIDELNDSNLKGIFHSFTGTLEQAHKIIEYKNFKIGINGIVTFKNAGLDKVVKEIDSKHIVIETDSPYLSPMPKRGKRNESSYLIYTAKKIADLYNMSDEGFVEITNKNTVEIFGDRIAY